LASRCGDARSGRLDLPSAPLADREPQREIPEGAALNRPDRFAIWPVAGARGRGRARAVPLARGPRQIADLSAGFSAVPSRNYRQSAPGPPVAVMGRSRRLYGPSLCREVSADEVSNRDNPRNPHFLRALSDYGPVRSALKTKMRD